MPFKKGNTYGTGNPWAAEVQRIKSILYKTVKTKDFKAIVQKLIDDAKAGDKAAAKLLIEYLANKPRQEIDISGNIPIKLYDASDANQV
jgi:ribosomal protein L17